MAPSISVVVVSRNEGEHLRRTIENLEDTLPDSGNVIVVDDGSTDGSADYLARRRGRVRLVRSEGLGVTRARNLGARQTRGQIIVFADAHLHLQPHWWKPLADQLRRQHVGAVAPVITPMDDPSKGLHGVTFLGPSMDVCWLSNETNRAVPVPILPGCCLAMRREVFLKTGGWDDGMLHRGNVDNELCIRLWLLGYELRVTPDTTVGHLFRQRSPYSVGWAEYLHNRLRLAFIHLAPLRLRKVVAALMPRLYLGVALHLIAQGDSAQRRRELLARRVRNDDWFFERFDLKW
jgi:GT2 family glycosyltransferase